MIAGDRSGRIRAPDIAQKSMIVARVTRPAPRLLCAPMPPLITREEALAARASSSDHAEIEALVERAWEARQEHFGDSTDMCSLVNAKSGGCAEDCGFCAQSRFAEAETPLHAMMEPEQILEHAAPPRPRARTASAWSPRARGCPSATSRRSSRARGSSPSTRTSSAARRSGT